VKLSVTVVTYRPDIAVLQRSMASLAASVGRARDVGLVSDAVLYVVDNGPGDALGPIATAVNVFATAGTLEILHGHGNVGYGRANNLVLPRLESDVHLVMNPDVELDRDTLVASIEELQVAPRIGAVAPAVRGPQGERQYLCKRYPTVWVLFLRGFAPAFVRKWFSGSLDRYEMRDLADDLPAVPVPLASGCFMLLRTEIFKRVGGFDPGFFMYFEDYDLSLRIGRHAQVAYVPHARIVHYGGEASRKGMKHVAWFVRSAWRFFAIHGWRFS
jgi:GT2 family glycosyltransferase